jgi:hypothetical protein
MSVLPAGRPLAGFLPDLEDLLEQPALYLAERPVTVGPRRMYGLAALFGVAGIAFLLSCVLGPLSGERLALGIGLLLGGSVWLGWSLMMRGHELVLRHDGVEVKYLDTTVWCPWALFNAGGKPVVADSDSPRVGLTLPVNPDAVPFVELRRNEAPVAHGAAVKSRQWLFTAADEAVLPARYEVRADELGALLLELGRKLGTSTPKGLPPPEAFRTDDLEDVPSAPGPSGWITVYLTRLRFPARCCDCGEPTSYHLTIHVEPGLDKVVGPMTGTGGRSLELPVPVCDACQEDLRARTQRGGSTGTSLGALAGLVGVGYFVLRGGLDFNTLAVLALGGLAAGGIVGFLVGTFAGRQLPVQVRRYDPARGTLSLRFRNPDYAAQVLDAMRAQARQSRR